MLFGQSKKFENVQEFEMVSITTFNSEHLECDTDILNINLKNDKVETSFVNDVNFEIINIKINKVSEIVNIFPDDCYDETLFNINKDDKKLFVEEASSTSLYSILFKNILINELNFNFEHTDYKLYYINPFDFNLSYSNHIFKPLSNNFSNINSNYFESFSSNTFKIYSDNFSTKNIFNHLKQSFLNKKHNYSKSQNKPIYTIFENNKHNNYTMNNIINDNKPPDIYDVINNLSNNVYNNCDDNKYCNIYYVINSFSDNKPNNIILNNTKQNDKLLNINNNNIYNYLNEKHSYIENYLDENIDNNIEIIYLNINYKLNKNKSPNNNKINIYLNKNKPPNINKINKYLNKNKPPDINKINIYLNVDKPPDIFKLMNCNLNENKPPDIFKLMNCNLNEDKPPDIFKLINCNFNKDKHPDIFKLINCDLDEDKSPDINENYNYTNIKFRYDVHTKLVLILYPDNKFLMMN